MHKAVVLQERWVLVSVVILSDPGWRKAVRPESSRARYLAGWLAQRSAQRIERPQDLGLFTGSDLFGQQPAGHRALR